MGFEHSDTDSTTPVNKGTHICRHQHQQELDATPWQQKAHGVWLSDVLKELFDPPAHDSGSAAVHGRAVGGTAVAAVDSASCSCSIAGFERTVGGVPVCTEPREDSLAAYSAQGSDGVAADESAAEGTAADVPVIPYEPDPSQTQTCVTDEPGAQLAAYDEPGFTLFNLWSIEPQKPDTPDSQDTLKLQLQEEGRKQAQRLREHIAEEEAASKRARLTDARLDDALDEVFLQERLCLSDGLPINFEEAVFHRHLFQEDSLQHCELDTFDRIVNCLPALYVGACHSPSFRWRGGFIERRGKMDGHCKNATQMHVLAARLGKLGKTAEEELIRYAQSRFGEKCTNKSWKSIGIKAEPTDVIFLYVVFR